MLAHSFTGRYDLNIFAEILTGSECDPIAIVSQLMEVLNEKESQVIKRRYGVFGERLTTLAAIGDDLGVTRERIRQIQVSALKKMTKASLDTELNVMHAAFMKFLMHCGGVVSEDQVEKFLSLNFQELFKSHAPLLKLALVLDDRVTQEYNKVDFVPHFRLNSLSFKLVKDISSIAIKILSSTLKECEEQGFIDSVKASFKSNMMTVSDEAVYSIICLDRRILLSENGFSLVSWRHVNPKTLSDKIEFVLNKIKDPMHFLKIVEKIEAESFDSKKVSMQAVHNELISNNKFVLIGRGIYAMRSWGFKEGTVSDVLESILSKKGPMQLSDLTQEVLRVRKVKPITVQINLSSKKNKFRKNREGFYELV
jgi:DNA-binding phage protein/DNA-directed RNA polymerase delta subunit